MVSLGTQVLGHRPVYSFTSRHGYHQLPVAGYALCECRHHIVIERVELFRCGCSEVSNLGPVTIEGRQPRGCPAIVIPLYYFQCVMYLFTRIKQCFQIMISIFSFPEDIESEIYFYRRFSYHNIPFFTAP